MDEKRGKIYVKLRKQFPSTILWLDNNSNSFVMFIHAIVVNKRITAIKLMKSDLNQEDKNVLNAEEITEEKVLKFMKPEWEEKKIPVKNGIEKYRYKISLPVMKEKQVQVIFDENGNLVSKTEFNGNLCHLNRCFIEFILFPILIKQIICHGIDNNGKPVNEDLPIPSLFKQ